MTNQEISHLFKNIAAAYAIKDEKRFRFQIIAYQKAAEAAEHASTELKTLYDQGRLEKIPGIGPTIKERLDELFKTGHVRHYEQILGEVSPAVFPLLDIPSFGPKKANKLVEHFKLRDPKNVIEEIKKLALDNKISVLDGFGAKSQSDILRAIEEYKTGTTKTDRMVLPYAFSLAQEVITYLKKSKDVIDAQPLGSLRRMSSTVGDVDIAVTTKKPENVIQYFVDFPAKERTIEKGPTTASILIGGGKHVDLLVLSPKQWGSLLQHFTGSKHHNVALREYSLKKGFSLSERGIKLTKQEGKLIEFDSEEKFYNYIGMDWIPPELRENQGEIEQAIRHTLPKLIDLEDIKGDLHVHSDYQIDSSHDYGNASMEDMIKKAHELKYDYIGFSEHNPSITNQHKEKRIEILKNRKEKIDKLNTSNNFGIRVINLLEVDILASGDIALNSDELEFIDAAIVSIHSVLRTPKEKMTERVLKGLSNPKAKILAHPTGRLINQRPGFELDWNKIFSFCAKYDKAIEINAWPERLDLPDTLVRQAKDEGVKFVINTDSHALDHMDNMFYGVSVARRGWCEAKNVLNTLPYEKFYSWLTKT